MFRVARGVRHPSPPVRLTVFPPKYPRSRPEPIPEVPGGVSGLVEMSSRTLVPVGDDSRECDGLAGAVLSWSARDYEQSGRGAAGADRDRERVEQAGAYERGGAVRVQIEDGCVGHSRVDGPCVGQG
jgi:hypothetical protein